MTPMTTTERRGYANADAIRRLAAGESPDAIAADYAPVLSRARIDELAKIITAATVPPDNAPDDPMPCEVCGTDIPNPDDVIWVQAESESAEAPICLGCDYRYRPATLADCYQD